MDQESVESISKCIGKHINYLIVKDDKIIIGFDKDQGLNYFTKYILEITDEISICCEDRYFTCDDELDSLGILSSIESRDGGEVEEENVPEEYGSENTFHQTNFLLINTNLKTITICAHNRQNGCYDGINISAKLYTLQ